MLYVEKNRDSNDFITANNNQSKQGLHLVNFQNGFAFFYL